MKIDYKNVTTILFTDEYNGRNVITGIGLIENKNVQDFAYNWEQRESMSLQEVPANFMDKLRKDFEKIEKDIRNKNKK